MAATLGMILAGFPPAATFAVTMYNSLQGWNPWIAGITSATLGFVAEFVGALSAYVASHSPVRKEQVAAKTTLAIYITLELIYFGSAETGKVRELGLLACVFAPLLYYVAALYDNQIIRARTAKEREDTRAATREAKTDFSHSLEQQRLDTELEQKRLDAEARRRRVDERAKEKMMNPYVTSKRPLGEDRSLSAQRSLSDKRAPSGHLSDTRVTSLPSDYRLLGEDQLAQVAAMTTSELAQAAGIGDSTARRWKRKVAARLANKPVKLQMSKMSPVEIQEAFGAKERTSQNWSRNAQEFAQKAAANGNKK